MRKPDEPTPREDATSLSAIGLGAGLSVALTCVALLALAVRFQGMAVQDEPMAPRPVEVAAEPAAPPSDAGADRLVGHVVTEDGRTLTGYLRWNGREASWADLLPATRPGSRALDGVRFGHLERLERTGPAGLRAVSRSGRVVELHAGGTVGRAATAPVEPVLTVESGGAAERVRWREVREVRFGAVAGDPASRRLHGTVTTASGDAFTGYVLWNEAEGLLSDRVGDEVDAGGAPSPFAEVAAVRRTSPSTLDIETRDGTVTTLQSRTLIQPGPGEILVADPGLGAVAVPWSAFRTLTVHAAERPLRHEAFDGGRPLRGTVTTADGESVSGAVAWDLDENTTAAVLDGQDREVRYAVELGRAATIERHRQGVRVTLRDGRSVYLAGTNDVNWANRGIRVGDRTVAWSDFRALRLELAGSMP